MNKLPAVVRKVFPAASHLLEQRKKRNQAELDRPVDVDRGYPAFDVERRDGGLTGVERRALKAVVDAEVRAAKAEARYEEARRAEERTHEIHEGHARRKHELALAHIEARKQFAWWAVLKYRAKVIGICVVSGAVILFIITHWQQEVHHAGALIFYDPPVIIPHHGQDYEEIRPVRPRYRD